MRNLRFLRLFRLSLLCFTARFRRSIFLMISVGVSILLFLGVALYMDFNYATYEKGNSRVQRNYVGVLTNIEEAAEKIGEAVRAEEGFRCLRGALGGVLRTRDGRRVNVTYNVLSAAAFPKDMYVYSGLDMLGNPEDLSNSRNFEKYRVIAGRGRLQGAGEVIISEAYGELVGKKADELVGEDVTMSFEEGSMPYRIVGVTETLLTEKRMNRPVMREICAGNGATEHLSLTVSAFLLPEALPAEAVQGWDRYLFFRDRTEYRKIMRRVGPVLRDPVVSEQLVCCTPRSMELDNRSEWASLSQVKAILLLIVAVLSGISVFGTMFNSVADRRREIGIRKALGASDGDILLGFLIENFLNSLAAIFLAVTLAAAGFLVYAWYMRQVRMVEYTIRFYPVTMALFLCFALSNILGFSLIPAYRASGINVVDTLRDE